MEKLQHETEKNTLQKRLTDIKRVRAAMTSTKGRTTKLSSPEEMAVSLEFQHQTGSSIKTLFQKLAEAERLAHTTQIAEINRRNEFERQRLQQQLEEATKIAESRANSRAMSRATLSPHSMQSHRLTPTPTREFLMK